jgi:probable F420-dependent oxidoreductase
MTKITIGAYVIPYHGDYPTIRDAWVRSEAAGAEIIYQPDHFTTPRKSPDQAAAFPGENVFECWTLMAAMAEATTTAQIGTLVTANAYRNPNLLADIVRTVDHISNGRVILGIGAGDRERDFVEYGYEYTSVGARLRDLERDLVVIKDRFAKLNPPPIRKVPILIGGKGEKVTLRLVAEHADIWHMSAAGEIEDVRYHCEVLERWCDEVGRDPAEIERAIFVTKWGAHGKKLDDYEKVVELGFTQLIAYVYPGAYDITDLEELVAWRDARGS